jgi:hypothetical protein
MQHKIHAEHKLPYLCFRTWTLCGRFFENRKYIADSETEVTCGICRKALERRNGADQAA